MKKKLLSVIALAAVAVSAVVLAKLPILQEAKSEVITFRNYAVPVGEIEINATNFPDENFRNFVSQYDKDKSGGLSVSEIKSVTEIKCDFKTIKRLKGIEYFTSLESLDCSYNQLSLLDVSKNTTLKKLICDHNNLTSLKVSENAALTHLNCSGNKITTLDVSKNINLIDLDCSYNSLESLDLSTNTKLTGVSCINNQLTSLDFGKCASLCELCCGDNKLTKLDVSNCSSLKRLSCARNELTQLNLGANEVLEYIWCICNQLKEVDVHLCPKVLDSVKHGPHTEYYLVENLVFYTYGLYDELAFDLDVTFITTGPSVGKVTGLKAESAGRNKVKLSWNAVDGADGYLVYAQKDGTYAYVGMTTKGTTFTDTKALDSDYNYYWVFAYVKDIDGSMVPGGCEKYVYAKGVCLAVTNLKAASQTGSVKLSWTASAGAEGYLIYGIRPGGSYGYIGMTTKGTTYTDTKASKEDYTFYWVFPYHKDADGTMIVGGTAKYTYGKAR